MSKTTAMYFKNECPSVEQIRECGSQVHLILSTCSSSSFDNKTVRAALKCLSTGVSPTMKQINASHNLINMEKDFEVTDENPTD